VKPRRSRPGTAERRRQILGAALACFSEIGFARTTMADIRRRARSSTGSIYHQFESKEHLAAELYLEGIGAYQAGWLAALEREADARRGIRAVIAHHLRWVRKHEALARYLFEKRHAIGDGPAKRRLVALNARFQARAAAWFAAQVASRRLRRMPADVGIALLAGPYLEQTRQYLSGRPCTEVGRATALLAGAAWRALGVEREERSARARPGRRRRAAPGRRAR